MPGNPGLNTMHTPLLLSASTTVRLHGTSCSPNGAMGRTALGELVMCESGVWRIQCEVVEGPCGGFNRAVQGQVCRSGSFTSPHEWVRGGVWASCTPPLPPPPPPPPPLPPPPCTIVNSACGGWGSAPRGGSCSQGAWPGWMVSGGAWVTCSAPPPQPPPAPAPAPAPPQPQPQPPTCTVPAWLSGSDAQALQRVYVAMLGRAGDFDGMRFWRSQMPGFTPLSIATTIGGAATQEVATFVRLAPGAAVHRVFRNALGRVPDPGGLAHWTSVARSQGNAAMAGHLIGSALSGEPHVLNLRVSTAMSATINAVRTCMPGTHVPMWF